MNDLLASVDFSKDWLLDDAAAAGDGGSLFLGLLDKNSIKFSVTFYQTRISRNFVNPEIPGFLLFNDIKVPVRSREEQLILTALKHLVYSSEFSNKDIYSLQKEIAARISFFESNEYLNVVASVSRNIGN